MLTCKSLDPMSVAALVSVNGLSAPSSDVCSDGSCMALAQATALQAKCETSSKPRPFPFNATIYCSRFGEATCITMDPSLDTKANFTTGLSTECGRRQDKEDKVHPWGIREGFECPSGDFAVVFGMWSIPDFEKHTTTHYTVDCKIEHGNATIRQIGNGTPDLIRETFTKSTAPIHYYANHSEGPIYDDELPWYWGPSMVISNYSVPFRWQASYLRGLNNPFTFASTWSGDNDTGDDSVAQYLLSDDDRGGDNEIDATNNTDKVARSLEATFDMATLFAFARAPNASAVDIETTKRINIWTYNAQVLSVLAIPLLATSLVLFARWKVYSNDIVIGYDPIGIARRADEVLRATPSELTFPKTAHSTRASQSRASSSIGVIERGRRPSCERIPDSSDHGATSGMSSLLTDARKEDGAQTRLLQE